MELYIGGYAQGKLDYVKNKYPDAEIFDEKNFKRLMKKKDNGTYVIWNHFHLAVKQLLAEGCTQEWIGNEVELLVERQRKLAVISDEIGSGIVPVEQSERLYRECTGRLLIQIAEKADEVELIICGISRKIK